MSELPLGLKIGERARLFPVLSETSKEGRTTSVFLACLTSVREYGTALLSSVGQRVGARASIEAFTEVGFPMRHGEKGLRPDGLIVVTVGSRTWSALVEAKVGNNELTTTQVESYLALAQANGVDAVITISNEFSATPMHHPTPIKSRARSKVDLFHWSWMYILTEADLLLSNDDVLDDDQSYLLSELARFLTHQSAGVKGFDAMPKAWTELANTVRAGGAIAPNSSDSQEVVGAWHQEVRDLSLILTRQVGVQVVNKLPRAIANDAAARIKSDIASLRDTKCLSATLAVPGAAAPIEVSADIGHRSVIVSAKLQAPGDKQSTNARLNWLLRQLKATAADDVHVRLYWPGRSPHTQHTLGDLRKDLEIATRDRPKMQVSSFEVCLVKQLGARFAQSKNFIKDLETIVPDFYENVLQHLRAWQAPAPRMREGRKEASDVTPKALAEDFAERPIGEEPKPYTSEPDNSASAAQSVKSSHSWFD